MRIPNVRVVMFAAAGLVSLVGCSSVSSVLDLNAVTTTIATLDSPETTGSIPPPASPPPAIAAKPPVEPYLGPLGVVY